MVFLQYIFIGVIVVILMFTAIGSMVHMKDMIRNIPLDTAPAQSV